MTARTECVSRDRPCLARHNVDLIGVGRREFRAQTDSGSFLQISGSTVLSASKDEEEVHWRQQHYSAGKRQRSSATKGDA